LSLISMWARAFAVTTGVEIWVAVPGLGRVAPRGRRAIAALIGQLATHPAVWFILPELHLPRTKFMLLAETWAVVVEALIYIFSLPELPWGRALVVSVVANAASVGVGLLLGF
jgi:hypothetical protein